MIAVDVMINHVMTITSQHACYGLKVTIRIGIHRKISRCVFLLKKDCFRVCVQINCICIL